MIASQKVYDTQEYLVKFDLGLVDVNISVCHQNKTLLTREEILEEAMGYAEDAGIKLDERDLFEIETTEMTEAIEKITEWCSNCQNEVELKNVFENQICPECDSPLKPCSICDTVGKCNECPLGENMNMIVLHDYEGEFEVELEWLKTALHRLDWEGIGYFGDNYLYDDAAEIREMYLNDIASLHLDCGSCGSQAVEKVGYGFKEGQGLFIRVICSTCGESSDCGDGEFFGEKVSL